MVERLKIVEELNPRFKQLRKNVEKIKNRDPENHRELFNETFMKKYTKFQNAEEFLKTNPFGINCFKELRNLNDENLNNYIRKTTIFESCNEMLKCAEREWINRLLSKGF